jgi:hypothetical protein
MSKTTFEPKAKTMSLADNPEPKETAAGEEKGSKVDSYESVSASKWKAVSSGSTSLVDNLGDAADLLGSSLEQTISSGILGENAKVTVNWNPMALTTEKAGKNEYLSYYDMVELPPSAVESIALFPDSSDPSAQSNAITEAVTYYTEYMDLYNARLDSANKAIGSHNISPHDAAVINQFITKLSDAVKYTQRQIDIISGYKKGGVENA